MADIKISALGAIGSVAGEDLVAIVDDPSGTPASRKATITQIATFINASALTASSTATFTNKTFDVEGTGNSISNIDVADLKSGVLDTDISSVSGSDDTIPSAKAVKTYVDAQIATEDTIEELNDTTITSLGDNELLQYDSTSSKWINQTLAEAGISPVAGSSSIVTVGTIGTGVWNGTAIASAYIAGDAIVASKIADNAIDSEHYTDGSIDLAHMSANSIDSDQYVDGSIDLAHLSADSVNGTKIADDSIDSEHIVDGSVDLAHMSVNSIDSDQYVDGSIDLAHLSSDCVNGSKIVDNAINSEHYTDGSIDRVHLEADIIDGTKLADNAVNSEHYTDGSIDNAHIADNAINSEHYADGSIDRAHLSADIIDGTKIADDVVASEHLAGTLTLTGTTTTAGIDVAGNNIDNVRNIIHDIETSGTDINFAEDDLQTIAISGNTTFSTAGRATGKSKVLRISADGTDRVCTFPSGIRWLGTAPDSNTYTVTANKYAIVTFTCFDANESGMLGVFALEE